MRKNNQKILPPRLHHDEWKSIKLTINDIIEVRKLYDSGHPIQQIADRYHVTYSTIRYHTDEDFKRRNLKRTQENTDYRLKHDAEYKKRYIQRQNNTHKDLIKRKGEPYHKYLVFRARVYRSKNRDKINKYPSMQERRSRPTQYSEKRRIEHLRYMRAKNFQGFRQFMSRINHNDPIEQWFKHEHKLEMARLFNKKHPGYYNKYYHKK